MISFFTMVYKVFDDHLILFLYPPVMDQAAWAYIPSHEHISLLPPQGIHTWSLRLSKPLLGMTMFRRQFIYVPFIGVKRNHTGTFYNIALSSTFFATFINAPFIPIGVFIFSFLQPEWKFLKCWDLIYFMNEYVISA